LESQYVDLKVEIKKKHTITLEIEKLDGEILSVIFFKEII